MNWFMCSVMIIVGICCSVLFWLCCGFIWWLGCFIVGLCMSESCVVMYWQLVMVLFC